MHNGRLKAELFTITDWELNNRVKVTLKDTYDSGDEVSKTCWKIA